MFHIVGFVGCIEDIGVIVSGLVSAVRGASARGRRRDIVGPIIVTVGGARRLRIRWELLAEL